ncbi:MAG: hypothetical protein Ct9H90mP23_0100 [Methanobacteriota archaeon]|nr:MAG: hypothetical protein Ct9H90mP23_0100 [Euryarchaeota archaeon]
MEINSNFPDEVGITDEVCPDGMRVYIHMTILEGYT